MATVANGFTTSFRQELAAAGHNLTTDTLKLALFDDSVTLNASTTAYATTNEVTGTGYSAGGVTLSLASGYPTTDANGGVSYRFDPAIWSSASFSARAGLIYNSSKANKAVLVLDFGQLRTVTSSTFTVTFPASLPPIIYLR